MGRQADTGSRQHRSIDRAQGPGQRAAVEWAYLSYSGVKDWTFQLGAKRLPLYYPTRTSRT